MLRNTSGQRWRVFAFNVTTNQEVTGDAANITAKLSKDYGTAKELADVNPTETEDGFYLFDLTQSETNAVDLEIYPESSTPDVQVIGVPGNFVTETSSGSTPAPSAPVEGSVPFGLDGPVIEPTEVAVPYFSQATLLDELQPIIQGDDYSGSNAFVFTVPAPSGYTDASVVTFGGHSANCGSASVVGWSSTGTITVDGANWILTFELTNAETDLLDETLAYHWSVQVAEDSRELTVKKSDVKRPVRVLAKQT